MSACYQIETSAKLWREKSFAEVSKRAISAKEIQRQIGRKRYQPVWEMVHKLRDVMGKRDARYNLHGNVKIDEDFFSTETPRGAYLNIMAEFLRLYLNELCYKFNRRYFGFTLIERLELCPCSYKA